MNILKHVIIYFLDHLEEAMDELGNSDVILGCELFHFLSNYRN